VENLNTQHRRNCATDVWFVYRVSIDSGVPKWSVADVLRHVSSFTHTQSLNFLGKTLTYLPAVPSSHFQVRNNHLKFAKEQSNESAAAATLTNAPMIHRVPYIVTDTNSTRTTRGESSLSSYGVHPCLSTPTLDPYLSRSDPTLFGHRYSIKSDMYMPTMVPTWSVAYRILSNRSIAVCRRNYCSKHVIWVILWLCWFSMENNFRLKKRRTKTWVHEFNLDRSEGEIIFYSLRTYAELPVPIESQSSHFLSRLW
jgi:hypothetical protein